MNTQQNQNEVKKKGVQVNPSRDIKYEDREKDFSGEFGEQIESAGQEVNAGELDNKASQGSAQGYEGNSPDVEMSSDLGGDKSRTSGQAKGSDLGSRQGTQKTSDQKSGQKQDDSLRQ